MKFAGRSNPYIFADLNGLHRTGAFGWHLSLTAQDEVVMLKQTGFDEVYSLDVTLP